MKITILNTITIAIINTTKIDMRTVIIATTIIIIIIISKTCRTITTLETLLIVTIVPTLSLCFIPFLDTFYPFPRSQIARIVPVTAFAAFDTRTTFTIQLRIRAGSSKF